MTTRKKVVANLPEELKKPNEDCFVEGILAKSFGGVIEDECEGIPGSNKCAACAKHINWANNHIS